MLSPTTDDPFNIAREKKQQNRLLITSNSFFRPQSIIIEYRGERGGVLLCGWQSVGGPRQPAVSPQILGAVSN